MMSISRILAAWRARRHARAAGARVAGYLRGEAGDTLIEVLVAGVLVALIALATFTGYTAIAHVAGDQNKRAQADSLAQQDLARLRGLTLSALAGSGTGTGTGNTYYTQTVDNTVYTVTSATKFVSGSGSQSCTSSTTTTADEVQTTSTVNWSPNNDGRPPVVVNGLVAPPEGGSLLARVSNSSGALSGATVTLSGGPTSSAPLTTDANGCAVFVGLAGGTYTLTASMTGYVTANTALTAVPTSTATTTFTLASG
jgi:type II secretory pathway pseudopilin PulG